MELVESNFHAAADAANKVTVQASAQARATTGRKSAMTAA